MRKICGCGRAYNDPNNQFKTCPRCREKEMTKKGLCDFCGKEFSRKNAQTKFCPRCKPIWKKLQNDRYKVRIGRQHKIRTVDEIKRGRQKKSKAPCKKCIYGLRLGTDWYCGYIIETKHMRGCAADESCDKFRARKTAS